MYRRLVKALQASTVKKAQPLELLFNVSAQNQSLG